MTTASTMKTYLVGNWNHLFAGNVERDCRIIVDAENRRIVSMEIKMGLGYEVASEDEMADLADSIFNTNAEALDDPEEWGLVKVSLPAGTFTAGVGPLPGATELQKKVDVVVAALEDTLPVVLASVKQAGLDPRDSGLVGKIDTAIRIARDGKGDAAGLLDMLYEDSDHTDTPRP